MKKEHNNETREEWGHPVIKPNIYKLWRVLIEHWRFDSVAVERKLS